jgi:hypothetical protein
VNSYPNGLARPDYLVDQLANHNLNGFGELLSGIGVTGAESALCAHTGADLSSSAFKAELWHAEIARRLNIGKVWVVHRVLIPAP